MPGTPRKTRAIKPASIPTTNQIVLCSLPQWLSFHQRSINQVLAQEPHLEFAGAKHIADHQIISAIVAQFIGALREFAAVGNDDLVRVQQAGQLYGNFFTALWRTRNTSQLSHIGRHRNTDSAQQLDSFRDLVDDLILLCVVFVEQKMELVKSRSRNLPM